MEPHNLGLPKVTMPMGHELRPIKKISEEVHHITSLISSRLGFGERQRWICPSFSVSGGC
jgi:hypothetical protein